MELIYTDEWSSYEEGGELEIYQSIDGDFVQYFYRTGGNSVYDGYDAEYWSSIEEISYEEAIELMLEWDEIESNFF